MAKIKIVLNIPDNDCAKCNYYGHSYFEKGYQCYTEENYCKLFGNVDLKNKDGKYQGNGREVF